MPTQLRLISSNAGKIGEIRKLLRDDVTLKAVRQLEIPEIQSLDVEEVVRDKAVKAYDIVRSPLIVEDTGLYLKAYDGFPGALVKWMLASKGLKSGNANICSMAAAKEDRSAFSKTAIAFCDGSTIEVFVGRTDGSISNVPRGERDFGWGPVFIPNGSGMTFGEMGPDAKNEVSSRAKAMAKLNEYLGARFPGSTSGRAAARLSRRGPSRC